MQLTNTKDCALQHKINVNNYLFIVLITTHWSYCNIMHGRAETMVVEMVETVGIAGNGQRIMEK